MRVRRLLLASSEHGRLAAMQALAYWLSPVAVCITSASTYTCTCCVALPGLFV